MTATLTVSPTQCIKGKAVTLTGAGFLASSPVTISVTPPVVGASVKSIVNSDNQGDWASADIAQPAIATLTSDATNVSDADTVTIGGVTYTFKTSLDAVANHVAIGVDAATSLANLKAAINAEAGIGTKYGTGTVVHPTVSCTAATSTTLKLVAKTGGTAGNSLASTETSSHLSFGGATFSGGAAASGESTLILAPEVEGLWNFSATDGTNTATAQLQVFTGGA